LNEILKDAVVSVKRVTTHRWPYRAQVTRALHCGYFIVYD